MWSSLAHYGLRALVLPTLRRNKEFVINEYNHDKRDEYWKPALSADEFTGICRAAAARETTRV